MHYHFVVNGRSDKAFILDELNAQLEGLDISCSTYVTGGEGDATRHVRLYCEFREKEDTCFVACGGSGTFNEVATALVGARKGTSVAFLAFGTTNDFIKCYPGRNFTSVRDLLNAEPVRIDALKCNEDYAFNVINFGFDAVAGCEAGICISEGLSKPYVRGVLKAMIGSRFNKFDISVDGEKISGGRTLLCFAANGKYCGGKYLCSPKSVVDDGMFEVLRVKACSLLSFLLILPKYEAGRHLQDDFCLSRMIFRRGRHMEISSRYLFYACLDGEMYISKHFEIDIVEKAVELRLPPLENQTTDAK